MGAATFALIITPLSLLRKSSALRTWTYSLLILLTIMDFAMVIYQKIFPERLVLQETTNGRQEVILVASFISSLTLILGYLALAQRSAPDLPSSMALHLLRI